MIASFCRQKGAVEGLKDRPKASAELTVAEVARRLKLSKATVY